MGKRFWSLVISVALVGGGFAVLPATAQAATVVPAEPNIVDPPGDANYLNEGSIAIGQGGNYETGDDASSVGDILAVWFTNTAETISWHVQTEAVQPSSGAAYWTEVTTNPDAEGTYCIAWDLVVAAPTYQADSFARVRDECTPGESIPAELTIEELEDETGVVTGTVKIADLPPQAAEKVLTQPVAAMRHATGPLPDALPEVGGATLILPTVDTTDVGTDYTITSGVTGGAGKPAKPTPPGKNDPPGKGKKKGCVKGKGKKKGACPGKKNPKPPVASCAPYTPGEEGAEAQTSVVTAAATEEKPVEVTIAAPSTTDDSISVFQNIQVGQGSSEVGLFARYEFPDEEDHDIYLNYADGTEAAHAGGFNPAPFVPYTEVPGVVSFGTDGTGGGGHSEMGAEQIDGIRTAPCGGYTLEMQSFLSAGGDMTLKLWLGEIENDPAPAPAADSQALTAFYDMTGLANPSVKVANASSTPAANKGCKKGKGKKKGCKKPPVACSPITPAEQGVDKPIVVLTDAATAEAPVEQPVTLEMSTADFTPTTDASYDFFNVQVDSASPSVGLYATFEFDARRDYDLFVRWSDGSEAASSHGFNPAIEASAPDPVPADPSNQRTNHAGESHADSENIVGLITPDCGGYTIETANWLGEGGDFTVKLWLGEGTTEPHAIGEVTAE